MAEGLSLTTTILFLLVTASPMASSNSACETCECSDKRVTSSGKTVVVDCSNLALNEVFQEASEWPYQLQGNATPAAVIDVTLDHNRLVRLHPLPNVPIVRFSVSHNVIVAVDDGAFLGPALTLEEIDLSFNRLTTATFHPDAFRGSYAAKTYLPLPKLRVLRLGRNALHSLHPAIFEHLPALEELYLEFNPFTVIDSVTVAAIATVIHLKVLDLSNTMLTTLPENFLHTPHFLEELYISGNRMTSPPSTLGQARALKKLVLDGNPIRHFHNESLAPMTKLTSLSVSRMPELVAIDDGAFTGLPMLREFHCSYNPKLLDIASYAFSLSDDDEFQQLTTLMLNNNHLSYLNRHIVTWWDKLEKIALQGNPWSCDCLNQWMITDLVPIIEKIDPEMTLGMMCYKPDELAGKTFRHIMYHEPHLRCLDRDGNHPENDGAMLVGVLVGALIAIIAVLVALFMCRRKTLFNGWCSPERATTSSGRFPGPGAGQYSRAFYKRSNSPEEGEF